MQKKQSAKKAINGAKKSRSEKIASGESLSYNSYVEALKKSEERYSLAQRTANIGSWDWDMITGSLSWSDAIEPLFGFKKGDFKKTYRAFIECVHPDDRKDVSNAINACIREKKEYQIEYRVVWPDRSIHWLLGKGNTIRNENSKSVRILGTVQDITQRKNAEELLKNKNESLLLLSESAGLLLSNESPEIIVNYICKKVMLFFNFNIFFNYLVNTGKGKNTLALNAYGGISKEEADKINTLNFGEYICGCAARDGKRIIAENIQKTNDKRADIVRPYGIRAYACHPLLSKDKVIGTLSFGTSSRDRFNEGELDFMQIIANYVAAAIERKQTEEIIKKEKEFSENILASMPDGMDIVTEDREIAYMNKIFQDIFGKDTIGRKCYEIYKDDKKQCVLCPLGKLIRMGETKTIEVNGIADGRTFLISHTGVMFGGKKSFMEVFKDITDYKTVEKKFLTLSHAVEQSHASIIITDTKGSIEYVNPHFTATTGYTYAESIGKNPRILKSGKQPPKVYTEMWDTIKSGKDWQGEFCNKKKNGSLFWERVSISPVKDGQGDITHFVAVKEDITERKHIEDILQKSREDLNRAQAVSHTGSWRLNVQQNKLSWSDETYQIFGIPKDTPMTYETFLACVHPDDVEHVNKSWSSALLDRRNYEVEHRIIAEGKIKWVRERAELEFDKKGELLGGFGTVQDITRRKQAEDEIAKSLKEKEVLLKEVHHRVKNNLQLVSSMLNLQFRGDKDKERVESLKESRNRIRSIALVHEKLYRSEDLSHIDLAGYIEELASNLFRSYADQSRDIGLKVNCDKIFIDIGVAIPCGLIINELVINSLKHAFPAGRRGTINISCLDKKNKIILVVSDNGIGLPEDPYLQNTKSIGLQLVDTLSDQLEANISITRKNGTSFKITLPKTAEKAG